MPLEDGSCVRQATSPIEARQSFHHYLTVLSDFLSYLDHSVPLEATLSLAAES